MDILIIKWILKTTEGIKKIPCTKAIINEMVIKMIMKSNQGMRLNVKVPFIISDEIMINMYIILRLCFILHHFGQVWMIQLDDKYRII